MAGSGDDEAALTDAERGRHVAGGGIEHDHGARPGEGVVHVGGRVRARSTIRAAPSVPGTARTTSAFGFAPKDLRVPRVSREDPRMARNEIVVRAAPDEMFTLLLDPYVYPKCVVGTRQVRKVDTDWPRMGARIHQLLEPGRSRLATRQRSGRHDRRSTWTSRCASAPSASPASHYDSQTPAVAVAGSCWTRANRRTRSVIAWRARDAVVHAKNALSLWRLRRLAESRVWTPRAAERTTSLDR